MQSERIRKSSGIFYMQAELAALLCKKKEIKGPRRRKFAPPRKVLYLCTFDGNCSV